MSWMDQSDFTRYLSQLVGFKVAEVKPSPNDGDFVTIVFERGGTAYECEVSRDMEGNGPGHLFGLPIPPRDASAAAKPVTFSVARPWGPEVAIVKADTHDGPGEAEFLKRLMSAVTKWVTTTKEGMNAWRRSSEDLNIADLSHELGDDGLALMLDAMGIFNLEIELVTPQDEFCCEWVYDTILVDAAAVEEAEGKKKEKRK